MTLTCILIALVGCKATKLGSTLACPGQIAISEEAANRVETRVRQTRRNGGPVRIAVTDEEAISYLRPRRGCRHFRVEEITPGEGSSLIVDSIE